MKAPCLGIRNGGMLHLCVVQPGVFGAVGSGEPRTGELRAPGTVQEAGRLAGAPVLGLVVHRLGVATSMVSCRQESPWR